MSISRNPAPAGSEHPSPRSGMRSSGAVNREAASSRPGLRDIARTLWDGFSRQHAAFVVACLYLIVEYNRPQQIWPFLEILPWAQLLVLSGLFLTALDPQARRPRTGVTILIVAYAVSMIFSTALAFSTEAALSNWKLWVSWIAIAVFLARSVSTRERVLLFVFVYYLVNLKMAQHGFRTWAQRGFGMAGWGVSGSPGWFENSGEFGMEMAMLVPLLVAHIMVVKSRFNRWVLVVGILFLVMATGSAIASNSRGALLGLGVAALWFVASSRKLLKALVVTAIATAAVFAAIPEETMARFSTAGTDLTSQTRLTYWHYGVEAVRENPLFGVGFRNWMPYLTDRHPEAFQLTGRIEVIHNTYLEAATELGLFGFTILIATLLYIFWLNSTTATKANRKGDAWLSATATGLNGSLLVYLITSFFMSVLTYPFVWVLLCLSAACASAVIGDQSFPVNDGRRPSQPHLLPPRQATTTNSAPN